MDKRYKGYKDISGTFWCIFISSAKKRKIEVSIDIKYLWDLYLKQKRRCLVSGVPLVLDSFERKKKKLKNGYYFASLDRIDNSLGYCDGNVRWIAREINYMKWKLTETDFLFFCKKISDNI